MEQDKWAFWRDWYLKMWEGDPVDWDFAFEVIKIDDAVWEDGADAVAEEIKRIRGKFELEREIASLREQLLGQQSIAISGHNQGPPLDEDTAVVRKQFELIWPILDDLEEAANEDNPDPNRLKELAEKLWDISIIIAKYCGGKADIILTKSAETIGVTGTKLALGTITATYVGTNESVQSVAKAAWQLAKTISGG